MATRGGRWVTGHQAIRHPDGLCVHWGRGSDEEEGFRGDFREITDGGGLGVPSWPRHGGAWVGWAWCVLPRGAGRAEGIVPSLGPTPLRPSLCHGRFGSSLSKLDYKAQSHRPCVPGLTQPFSAP